MPHPNNEAVLDVLRSVYDPCSIASRVPMNVVEMGLVQGISFDSDGACRVNLVLTSVTCFQVPHIEKAIENAILTGQLAQRVEVIVNHDQLWSPELMADHASVRIKEIRRASLAVTGTRRRQWKEEAGTESASNEVGPAGEIARR